MNLKFILQYFAILVGLFWMVSCKAPQEQETLQPEIIRADTVFKEAKVKDLDFKILQNSAEFTIELNGKPLGIQLDAEGEPALVTDFSLASYINSQHTAILVQLQDHSGLVAPFYIVSLQSGQARAYRLYRNSSAAGSIRFATGKSDIGRSAYLINNDFLVTRVDGRVYFLKRQLPEQRIQGLHIMNAADKKTLVFLVNSTLYQVHYPSGKSNTLVLPANTPLKPVALFAWIQQNLTWNKDQDQISFLKPSAADIRVRSLTEFK